VDSQDKEASQVYLESLEVKVKPELKDTTSWSGGHVAPVKTGTNTRMGPLNKTLASFSGHANNEIKPTSTGNVPQLCPRKQLGMKGVCRTRLNVPKLPNIKP
jgi:hypothetical protein